MSMFRIKYTTKTHHMVEVEADTGAKASMKLLDSYGDDAAEVYDVQKVGE